MCQRYAEVCGNRGSCAYARHHLKINTVFTQELSFLAASAEYERIPSLKANYFVIFACELSHQPVYFVL